MKKPNFFIVGSTKSGTTSLHNYLSQHHDIFMSKKKEPHYFCYRDKINQFMGPGDKKICKQMVVDNEVEYQSLFELSQGQKILGESTATYLHIAGTAKKIYDYNPNAKILISLRNPVDRAISAYNHLIRDGREFLDFGDALKVENQRLSDGWMPFWGYQQQSFYYENVHEYLELFGSDNVKIIIYERDFQDVEKLLCSIQMFLGVEIESLDYKFKDNISGIPKYKLLHEQLRRPNSLLKPFYKLIPKNIRRELKNRLNEKNLKVSKEIPLLIKQELKNSFTDDVEKLDEIVPDVKNFWGY
jgi:hypothetical protein